jgi:acyl dehydratase
MVVHGEERFEFHRPVYAGDVLDTVTTIADIRDAGRNELMTLVSQVTSNGEPVATVTNTIVSRGTAAPKEA